MSIVLNAPLVVTAGSVVDPRMVTNGRNTLSAYNVYEGLITYDLTDNTLYVLDGGSQDGWTIATVQNRGMLTNADWSPIVGGTHNVAEGWFYRLQEDDPRMGLSLTNGIPNEELTQGGQIQSGGQITIHAPGAEQPYLILNINTTALPIGMDSFRANGFIAGFERFGADDPDLGDYETFITRLNNDLTVFTVITE